MTRAEELRALAEPDAETLAAAYRSHRGDAPKFTRRMVINIADFFGMEPMRTVIRLERDQTIKRGSVDWFIHNGGITREHVKQVRAENEADRAAALRALAAETQEAG